MLVQGVENLFWNITYCAGPFSSYLGAAFGICMAYTIFRDLQDIGKRKSLKAFDKKNVEPDTPAYDHFQSLIEKNFETRRLVTIGQVIGFSGVLFYLTTFLLAGVFRSDVISQCLVQGHWFPLYFLYLVFPSIIICIIANQIRAYLSFNKRLGLGIDDVKSVIDQAKRDIKEDVEDTN
mgnify:CR=1 FL=1